MSIAISIVAVLVALIFGFVAIVCVHLHSQYKYGNQSRLAVLEEQFEAWSAQKRANPIEIHDRLVALENKAGIMIGRSR